MSAFHDARRSVLWQLNSRYIYGKYVREETDVTFSNNAADPPTDLPSSRSLSST